MQANYCANVIIFYYSNKKQPFIIDVLIFDCILNDVYQTFYFYLELVMVNNSNENAIREAAYFIWQNAGCPTGRDQEFWAMAVEQFNSCNSKSSSKKSCSSSKKSTSATCKSALAKKTSSSKKSK